MDAEKIVSLSSSDSINITETSNYYLEHTYIAKIKCFNACRGSPRGEPSALRNREAIRVHQH